MTTCELLQQQVGSEPIQFVSLFDDALDVWMPEDFRLLENFSIVARWSAPDEFRGLLLAG